MRRGLTDRARDGVPCAPERGRAAPGGREVRRRPGAGCRAGPDLHGDTPDGQHIRTASRTHHDMSWHSRPPHRTVTRLGNQMVLHGRERARGAFRPRKRQPRREAGLRPRPRGVARSAARRFRRVHGYAFALGFHRQALVLMSNAIPETDLRKDSHGSRSNGPFDTQRTGLHADQAFAAVDASPRPLRCAILRRSDPAPDHALQLDQADAASVVPYYEAIAPAILHAGLRELLPDAPSAMIDIIARSGRDAAWLALLGHEVVVIEPSAAMQRGAMPTHPDGGRCVPPWLRPDGFDRRIVQASLPLLRFGAGGGGWLPCWRRFPPGRRS